MDELLGGADARILWAPCTKLLLKSAERDHYGLARARFLPRYGIAAPGGKLTDGRAVAGLELLELQGKATGAAGGWRSCGALPHGCCHFGDVAVDLGIRRDLFLGSMVERRGRRRDRKGDGERGTAEELERFHFLPICRGCLCAA